MSLFPLLPLLLWGSLVAGQSVLGGYWPVYESLNLTVQNISWDLLNHVDYFLAATTQNFTLDLSGGFPLSDALDDIADLVDTAHANNATVSLTLGGYYGSVYFSGLVDPTNQTAFVDSLVQTVHQYDFDGVDIDWEFPNAPNSGSYNNVSYTNLYSPQDVPNFVSFLTLLRQVLGDDKIISATISAAGWTGSDNNTLSDYSDFASSLSYLSIMLYDTYLATISQTTGPNAPLYSTCDLNNPYSVDEAITYYINAGMPADQLVLAVPGYGHEFITVAPELSTQTIQGYQTMMYQKNTLEEPTYVSPTYNQLIEWGFLSADGSAGSGGYTRYWDNCTETPFLFNPDTRSFISYDDPQSITLKAQYAQSKGLAGVVLFDLSEDTPSNALLEAINSVLPAQETEQRKLNQKAASKRAAAVPDAHKRGRPFGHAGARALIEDDWKRAAFEPRAVEGCSADDEYFILPPRPGRVLGHNVKHGVVNDSPAGDAQSDGASRRVRKKKCSS